MSISSCTTAEAVLIIFPLSVDTITIAQMLSVKGEGVNQPTEQQLRVNRCVQPADKVDGIDFDLRSQVGQTNDMHIRWVSQTHHAVLHVILVCGTHSTAVWWLETKYTPVQWSAVHSGLAASWQQMIESYHSPVDSCVYHDSDSDTQTWVHSVCSQWSRLSQPSTLCGTVNEFQLLGHVIISNGGYSEH